MTAVHNMEGAHAAIFRDHFVNSRWVGNSGQSVIPLHSAINADLRSALVECSYEDVDQAVRSAREGSRHFSRSSMAERAHILDALEARLEAWRDQLAASIVEELGIPRKQAHAAHIDGALMHVREARMAMGAIETSASENSTLIVQEPVGVCALITPWNWPINQVVVKLAYALAAGCSIVWKPSEIVPGTSVLLAEVIAGCGIPDGVFNMVMGGPRIGERLAQNPDVDMVSFTGSTVTGRSIMRAGSETIKRMNLELGGSGFALLLDEADLENRIRHVIAMNVRNNGQTCNAPTRLIVPHGAVREVEALCAEIGSGLIVGDPHYERTDIGPLATASQLQRVRNMVMLALSDGASLVSGDFDQSGRRGGWFVGPTVLGDVTPEMKFFQDEVFAPVIGISSYRTLDEAIAMANGTIYGLSGTIFSASRSRAFEMAREIRSGTIHFNGAPTTGSAPYGGVKQSGLGRERGVAGLREYLETKTIYGGSF